MFFDKQVAFLVKILVCVFFLRKAQKKRKSIMFYMTNCKKEQFCFVLLVFFAKMGLADPFGKAPGARTIAAA